MALYRFKSRQTSDLLMLQATAERVLTLIGKDPSAPGIILHSQIPAAIQTLRDAVAQDEAQRQADTTANQDTDLTQNDDPQPPARDNVSLRVRCAPFIDMLQRCQGAEVDIVWGV
ncbi:MAG: hypothetical protein RLZZ352_2137 [Pseudomonadota bacterium]|jgi:ElaB/YqjD/DUF883 family membrane-anchored ribosome-binding protein